MGFSLPFDEFVGQASNYRSVFHLDFGFGGELWATFDDEPAFDHLRCVIANGKFIDVDGSIRRPVMRCKAIGISVQVMMMADQQDAARSGDKASAGNK